MVEIPNASEAPIIKVIGVGGGGCNAVKNMKAQNIKAIDYMAIDPDEVALTQCYVEQCICLGEDGDGTGGDLEVARKLAETDADFIREQIGDHIEMVFVTACLGKGTGTGAGPVVAKIAKDMGILTIGVVTLPNRLDGPRAAEMAAIGLDEFKKSVDSLVIIASERISVMYPKMGILDAYAITDDILTSAVRGISEIITCKGYVNVDMNDVKTTLKDSGDALFGTSVAYGESRADDAVHAAINSPLLINNQIRTAKDILLNISYSDKEPSMDELGLILETINYETNDSTDIIYGLTKVDGLEEGLGVTIVITGQSLKIGELCQKPQPVVVTPKNPYDIAAAREYERAKQMDAMQTKQPQPQYGYSSVYSAQPVNAVAEQPAVAASQPAPKPTMITPVRLGEGKELDSTPAYQRNNAFNPQSFAKVEYSTTCTYNIATNSISNINPYIDNRPD